MHSPTAFLPALCGTEPSVHCIGVPLDHLTAEMMKELIIALQHNPFLTQLVFRDNSLSAPACRMIFDLIRTNPKLSVLEITDNGMSDDLLADLSEILKRLPQNRDPISLKLRHNAFTANGALFIAQALEQNVPVAWLDLRNNPGLADLGIERIALAITENTHLRGLDLSGTGCADLGAAALSEALSVNCALNTLRIQDRLDFVSVHSIGLLIASPQCHLQSLYLEKCSMHEGLDVLCRALQNNKSISTLSLAENQINDSAAYYLSYLILKNDCLVNLDLRANRLSVCTAGFCAVALARNKTIQFLDISGNNFRASGVWALAAALNGNKTLNRIDLRGNGIDQTSEEALCELVLGKEVLRLSGNILGNVAVSKFAGKLAMNETLRKLDLNGVGMLTSGFIVLCQALCENVALEHLSVNENRILPIGLKDFGCLLAKNRTLKKVGIADCQIEAEGCSYVADGLMANETLRSINLSRNQIGFNGLVCLCDALIVNSSIVMLTLNNNPFEEQMSAAPTKAKIDEIVDRNRYYRSHTLMRDMADLVWL
jgi:Ran GTPase-activating protein (RanGAP) involved in mRNA processing and transport